MDPKHFKATPISTNGVKTMMYKVQVCLVILHNATWVCFQRHVGFITCLQVNFWWFQVLMCNPSMEFQPRVHEVVIYSDLRTSHLFPLNSGNTKPFLGGHYPPQQFSTCYPYHAAHAVNPHKCTPHY